MVGLFVVISLLVTVGPLVGALLVSDLSGGTVCTCVGRINGTSASVGDNVKVTALGMTHNLDG
jgi:hypothetical protein